MISVRKAKSARILVAACAAVLSTATASHAATQTWNGGGANDNWLTGGNWVGGTAPAANDALIFDGAERLTPNNNFAAGTAFTGITFAPTAGAFILGGNSITLSGDIGDDTAGQFETINLGLALDANRTLRVGDSAFLNVNGVISGTGFGITKTGNGTLTIGAANTYTGPTVLDGGTVVYNVDNTVGALNFGFTPAANSASTNTSVLDLSSASLTASSVNVQSNSTTANNITIGTGKTLTVNGAFVVGLPEVYTETVSGPQTNLNVSGETLVINGGANHFIANLGRSNAKSDTDPRVTIDMSNLLNFTYAGTTGEFRVGAGNGRATVTLANTSNSITAAQIRIGDSTATASGDNNGNSGPRSTLHMGGGTNVLAANTIVIGSGKSGGALDFLNSSGTVRITGEAGGTSTANITVGSSTSGTGTNDESQLLLAGHDSIVQAGNVIFGRLAGATGGNPGSARGNGTFDTGTFSANSFQLAVNSSGTSASTVTGNFTLGGPGAGSASTAVFNVANTFNLANRTNTNAASGKSQGTFTINGGTANINADILDASTTVSNAGINSTTFTLDGGTLNLGGHNIGTYTAPISSINLNSGTFNGAARVAGTVINIGSAIAINGTPTYVLSDAGSLNSSISPLTLVSGGGLEGGGTTTGGVSGDVIAASGSHISPGSATAQGSLQFFNNLTLNNGSTVKFKLSENTGSGNDFIVTNGLSLSGTVNLALGSLGLGPQNGNTYTIFTYSGALTGNETNFNVLGDGSRSTFTVIPTSQTPGTIQLSVTAGSPLALTWVGNNGDNWQTGAPTNWKDSTNNNPQQFFTNDQVVFDQSSTNLNPVQIPVNVSPGSVRVSADRDYKFAGAGGIAGNGNLLKEGNGTLTIATNNTYSGETNINAGTVRVGDGGTTGTLGGSTININAGTLVFNRSNALTVNNIINGAGSVVQNGAGATTLGGANSFAGGLTVNAGAVRIGALTAAGSGTITVNSPGALVTGVGTAAAPMTNPITLNNGSVLGASATSTLGGDVTANGTAVTIRGADPTNLPTAANTDINELVITGALQGTANVNVLGNGQDNNPDGGNGIRLRGEGTSNYSGTISVGNNVKFELQTTQSGPFSPAGTGKINLAAGDANLGGTLTTVTRTGGYSEINLRNNSAGDTVLGNDITITGTGLAILNALGNAPTGAKTTMGKLTAGTGQEVAVYLNTGNTHVIEFTSTQLNGTTTFSPKKQGFGTDASVGSDLSLANITESTPSGINMNGLKTLILPTGNNYTGTTAVNSGTLRVTNTTGSATGSGAVTVAGGANLTGSGIIGGDVTANSASHVAPGVAADNSGIGTLTLGGLSLANTANLDFDGAGNTFDLLNVTKNNGLTFSGNATLNLAEVSTLTAGDYTLIDYAGTPIGNLSGKLSLSNNSFAGGALQGSLIDDAASTSIKLHLAAPVQGPPQWNVDSDGSWSVAGNWSSNSVPDGNTAEAGLLGVITAPRTITLDGNHTVATLSFDNGNKYTIAPGTGGTLTIGDGTNGAINVTSGSHEISSGVALAGNVTKSGPGTLTISGPQSHGAGAALNVTQGRVNLNSNAGTPGSAGGSNLSVNVGGGSARVSLGSSQDLKGLTVSFGDAGTQTLDLASPAAAGAFNGVNVYAADLNGAKSALSAAIRNANAAGAADPLDGIIDSGLHSGSGIGIAIVGDHVAIRPTRIGDLNLDGSVTISDFIDLASNFNATNKTWQEGDLNNDGSVTISDFIDLASNFNGSYSGSIGAIDPEDQQTLASFASSIGVDPAIIGSAVPEPATLSLLAVGALGLMRRRRRQIDKIN